MAHMVSYQIIADSSPEDKGGVKLEPRSIYLSVHDRAKDEYGEFHWGIVVTLENGTPMFHHATNTNPSNPAHGTWFYEMKGGANGEDIRQSQNLLVFFKLKTLDVATCFPQLGSLLMILEREPIPKDGRNSVLKDGELFSCETWIRGAVEKLGDKELTSVNAEVALFCGSEAARDYRKELQETGKAVEKGRFRIVWVNSQ